MKKNYLIEIFKKWKNALLNPKHTFSKEKKHATFNSGALYILISGFIIGIISSAISYSKFSSILPLSTQSIAGLDSIIGYPFIILIGWIVFGSIIYSFARLFKGNGDYGTQMYLISLYMAPVFLLQFLFGLIPVIGWIINLGLVIYSLYLLTIILQITHHFQLLKAILTWIFGAIVFFILEIIFLYIAIISA